MNFLNIYEKVLNVFPTVHILDKPIPNHIFKSYYLMHNKKLDGTIISLGKDQIIIKDRNTEDYIYFECFFDSILMRCHIIPYDINMSSFDPAKRARIIYKLFYNIIEKCNFEPYSDEMFDVIFHAPFALTVYLLNEVEVVVNHKELCDLINNEFIQNYPEEICAEILDLGLENLLQYGALYPIVDKFRDILEVKDLKI